MSADGETRARNELILASARLHADPPNPQPHANCFRVLHHALDAAGLWDQNREEHQSGLFHGDVEDPVLQLWYATLIELTRVAPGSRLLEGAGDLDRPAGAYFAACWLTPAGEAAAEELLSARPDWEQKLGGRGSPRARY